MNTIYPPSAPVSAIVQSASMRDFKSGVDTLLQKRDYFIQKILPKLVEGRDYYTIKGKKSLGKAGAEKLATIYSLVAMFAKDKETMESFQSVANLVAYVCTLTRSGEVVGQGRGAAVLKLNGNDANKTVKMAQKSAFIDGVIRCTGLSDIFTQDLETMPIQVISEQKYSEIEEVVNEEPEMTEKQKNFLMQLIFNLGNEKTREEYLVQVNSGLSRYDASELISSLIPAR